VSPRTLAGGGPGLKANRVHVAAREGSYDVLIAPTLVSVLGQTLRSLGIGGRIALVSDSTVLKHWGAFVSESLTAAEFSVVSIPLQPGEATKSLHGAEPIYARLIKEGFGRSDILVALGGGVVGDLAGFVAATYHRGMTLVHVPTTLLAQVDSSIGGKVAVDHPLGKNLIGAFYSPRAVICDPTVLKSLARRERWSGVAEVVKAALVADEQLVQWLERDLDIIGNGLASEARMSEVVERAVRIKASIVSEDEREQGRRAILNFGHTLGHALEAVTGYGPLTHGEAIVIGMRVALEVSAQLGHCTADDAARALALLSRFPAPPPVPRPSRDAMIAAARRDKKARSGAVRFVVLTGIGKAEVEPTISDELLGLAVDRALAEFPDRAR
jgi:3-dehydroquinate synthase